MDIDNSIEITKLHLGIIAIIEQWTIVKLASDQLWAGHDTATIIDDIIDDIAEMSNRPFKQTKLENLLHDFVSDLNAVAEDGSVQQVCKLLIQCQEDFNNGKFDFIDKLIESNETKPDLSKQSKNVSNNDNDDDDDNDDDNSNGMEEDDQNNNNSNNDSKNNVDDDGWTTVSSSKKKGGK